MTRYVLGDGFGSNQRKDLSLCCMLLASELHLVARSRLHLVSHLHPLYTCITRHRCNSIFTAEKWTLTTDSGFLKAVEVNSLADVDQTGQSLCYHLCLLKQKHTIYQCFSKFHIQITCTLRTCHDLSPCIYNF